MYTIAITNQKGGVAKTTTAQAIGDYFRDQGARVLFVDLDPQSNLSLTFGVSGGAFDTLLHPAAIADHITSTDRGDILAADPSLCGADAAIDGVGREYRLIKALQAIAGRYDYCVIDTAPALGVLTINALTACNGVVVPVQADFYSLQGMSQISQTLAAVKEYTNKNLNVLGILITRHNARTVIRRDITEIMEKHAGEMGTRVFDTKIRECTAIIEAQANQQSIYQYAPRSNAAADYTAFMQELTGGLNYGQ